MRSKIRPASARNVNALHRKVLGALTANIAGRVFISLAQLGASKMEIWKIRQKSTGLFSVGGDVVRNGVNGAWSEKGKNWNRLNHLKSHLNINATFYRRNQNDIEIVKMILTVSEKDTIPMKTLLDDREKRHKKKEEIREQSRRERRLAELEREQQKLKDELKVLKGGK
jgi:hypothetical protein